MFQIKNLNISHRKDLRPIISGLSLTLNDGDKAAVIGEEGNGKSTLLKWLCDPASIDSYTEWSGEVIGLGNVGYLAQEMPRQDKAKTVYEYLCEDDSFFLQSQGELSRSAANLGIPLELFYSEQLVATLSGGEKVKLQMAKLIARRPDLLLLDEPSNDIDIETLEWLENFINAQEVPVLYISHDEVLLERTANKIVHIELVRRKTVSRVTVAKCGYREYVSERMNSLEKQEQLARKEKAEFESQQERWEQICRKVERDQNANSRQDPHSGRLLKKKMHAVKSMQKRFEREAGEMTQLPDVEEQIFLDLNKCSVPNGKTVLELHLDELTADGRTLARNIDLNICGAKHICIVGKNGGGKTTLLRIIADELLPRDDLKVFYMPQDYDAGLDTALTPVEFLSVTGDKAETDRIRTFLGCVKYTADEMFHPIGELSGGQRAKLFFIKMSLGEYNVLILDEPTRNFSPLSNPVIRGILKSFTGTIISVSHDRKYISEVCDTVYRLDENGIRLEKGRYVDSC